MRYQKHVAGSADEQELLLLERTLIEIAELFQISTPDVDRMVKEHGRSPCAKGGPAPTRAVREA